MKYSGQVKYLAACLSAAGMIFSAGAAENLLRNGNFEGSMCYWITSMDKTKYWEEGKGALDDKNPACGQFAARLTKGELRSTPFALEDGKPALISMFLRSDEPGTANVRLVPTDRGAAIGDEGGKYAGKFTVGTEWKRFSLPVTPKRSSKSWNWCLLVKSDSPLYVDGVSVVQGDQGETGKDSYVPRRSFEILADAMELPGYLKNGNMMDRDSTVKIRASVSNPGKEAAEIIVRWELLDYEGTPFGHAPVEKKITLDAGKTWTDIAELKLDHNGLLLAKVSAVSSSAKTLDSSVVPLTVIPFPKAADKPDMRERIGCSLRGAHTTRLAQKIGFRWVRWGAEPMGWAGIQPKGPDDWQWVLSGREEESIDFLNSHGFAVNFVLYGMPEWAKPPKSGTQEAKAVGDLPFWTQPGTALLPKDMPWPANDPRWNDLAQETLWDKYVKAVVTKYKDKSVVWEFYNEPEPAWKDSKLYAAMAKRTGSVVKQANPQAFYLTNQIDPTLRDFHIDFVRAGGAKVVNAHSWHNYGSVSMGGEEIIKVIRKLFKSGGNPNLEVWFNEGGAFSNSAQDYAALILEPVKPSEWANGTVRNIAELFSAGETKHILFHIGYGMGPRSWWDWTFNGGTELWDDDGLPTSAVATWNVLIDQLGLSENVKTVKNDSFTAFVFQDLRNGRGVAVISGNGKAVKFSVPLTDIVQRDVMGNDTSLKAEGNATDIALRADSVPVYLFTKDKLNGKDLSEKLSQSQIKQ